MKNAGCPPNIGGREVGALTAGLSAFKSWMLIIVAGVCGDGTKFHRAMAASVMVSPSSSSGWPNVLKTPWPSSGRLGARKLFRSWMFTMFIVASQLCRPAVVAAGILVVGRGPGGEDELLLGAGPAVAVAVEAVAAGRERFVDGGVAVVIHGGKRAVEALREREGRCDVQRIGAARRFGDIEDAIVVVVRVARVAESITVDIRLARIGDRGAVVLRVQQPVTVAVRLENVRRSNLAGIFWLVEWRADG